MRELLGTPLNARLWSEIEAIDLLALDRSPAPGVLLLASEDSPGILSLRDRLGNPTRPWDYQHMPGSKVWLERGLDQHVAPLGTLQAVVDWLCGDRQ